MDSHRIVRRGVSFDLLPAAESGPGLLSMPYDLPVWSGETPPTQADWDAALEEVAAQPVISRPDALVSGELVEQQWRPIKLLGRLTMPFGIGTWRDIASPEQEKAPEVSSAVPTF